MIIFEDNFIDNRNNWPTKKSNSSGKNVARIRNGQYCIEHNPKESPWLILLPQKVKFDQSNSFTIEIMMEMVSESGNFGIIWNFKNDENYYCFQNYTMGAYSILEYRNKKYISLIDGKQSLCFKAVNKFRINSTQDFFELYINSICVERVKYNTDLLGGDIGFIVNNAGKVKIHNIVISDWYFGKIEKFQICRNCDFIVTAEDEKCDHCGIFEPYPKKEIASNPVTFCEPSLEWLIPLSGGLGVLAGAILCTIKMMGIEGVEIWLSIFWGIILGSVPGLLVGGIGGCFLQFILDPILGLSTNLLKLSINNKKKLRCNKLNQFSEKSLYQYESTIERRLDEIRKSEAQSLATIQSCLQDQSVEPKSSIVLIETLKKTIEINRRQASSYERKKKELIMLRWYNLSSSLLIDWHEKNLTLTFCVEIDTLPDTRWRSGGSAANRDGTQIRLVV